MQGVPDDEHHIVHITQLLFPDWCVGLQHFQRTTRRDEEQIEKTQFKYSATLQKPTFGRSKA